MQQRKNKNDNLRLKEFTIYLKIIYNNYKIKKTISYILRIYMLLYEKLQNKWHNQANTLLSEKVDDVVNKKKGNLYRILKWNYSLKQRY